MADIEKGRNTSYSRYEELIHRRDNLKKEAFQYHALYVRTFGDLILDLFIKKIECIQKKKTIEYCQAALNHGRSVDQNALQAYLEKEMQEFQKQLQDMIKDHESSLKAGAVTQKDLLEIKRIYYKLVKLIHPDINPAVTTSPELMDLWHRVSTCYSCNDLQSLLELDVLVHKALESADLDDLEIPDIEDKIFELEKEIQHIMDTDPYQYKFLLDDTRAVETKKEDLKKELKTYEDYGRQLDEVLEGIIGSGLKITWQMK